MFRKAPLTVLHIHIIISTCFVSDKKVSKSTLMKLYNTDTISTGEGNKALVIAGLTARYYTCEVVKGISPKGIIDHLQHMPHAW